MISIFKQTSPSTSLLPCYAPSKSATGLGVYLTTDPLLNFDPAAVQTSSLTIFGSNSQVCLPPWISIELFNLRRLLADSQPRAP